LDQDSHNPFRGVAEVYDDPHPSLELERMGAVETLPARARVSFPVFRPCNRGQDRVNVIKQPRAATERKMQI
jgi:hypothetical protein